MIAWYLSYIIYASIYSQCLQYEETLDQYDGIFWPCPFFVTRVTSFCTLKGVKILHNVGVFYYA